MDNEQNKTVVPEGRKINKMNSMINLTFCPETLTDHGLGRGNPVRTQRYHCFEETEIVSQRTHAAGNCRTEYWRGGSDAEKEFQKIAYESF